MSRTVQARFVAGLVIIAGVLVLFAAAAAAWTRPDTTATGGTCPGAGARTPIVWTVFNRETGNAGSPATVTNIAVTPPFPTSGGGDTPPNTGSSSTALITVVPAAYHGPVALSYVMHWAGTAGGDTRPGGAHIAVVACPVTLPSSTVTTTPPCSLRCVTSTTTPPCSVTCGQPTSTVSTLPPCGPPSSTVTSTTVHRPRCVPTTTRATPSTTAAPTSMTSPMTSTTICTTTTTEATTSTTEAPTTTSTVPASTTSTAPASTTSTTASTVPVPVSTMPPDSTPPGPGPFTVSHPAATTAVASMTTLPVTGSSSGPLAVLGACLVGGGMLLVRRARTLEAT